MRTPLANTVRKYPVSHVIHRISTLKDLLLNSEISKVPQQARLISRLRLRVAEGLPDKQVAALCLILGGRAMRDQVYMFDTSVGLL